MSKAPKSYRTFIQYSGFTTRWLQYGLGDEEMRKLERLIQVNPDGGDVVVGTGGLRKMRLARDGRGKSGGFRIGYAHFPTYYTIILLMIYTHNEQDNFTPMQKATIKRLMVEIEQALK